MKNSFVLLLNFYLFLSSETFPTAGTVDKHHQTIIYIRSLINLESRRDGYRNHDVALIRLEEKSKSGMFDIMADKLLEKNEQHAVYLHLSFDAIPANRTITFSFFIIFTDIEDYVRN